jgi:hypothetical protein
LVHQHAKRFGQFGISTRVPPHCFRLAPLAENLTVWQSVSYLTISNAKFNKKPVVEFDDSEDHRT